MRAGVDAAVAEAWREAIAYLYPDYSEAEHQLLLTYCCTNDFDPIAREAFLIRRDDDGQAVVLEATAAAEATFLKRLADCGARAWYDRERLLRRDEAEANGIGAGDVGVVLTMYDDESRQLHKRDALIYSKLGWTQAQIEAQLGPVPMPNQTLGIGIWRAAEGDDYTRIRNWSPMKAACNRARRAALRQRLGNTRVMHDVMTGKPEPDAATMSALFGNLEFAAANAAAEAAIRESGRARATGPNPLGRSRADDSLID